MPADDAAAEAGDAPAMPGDGGETTTARVVISELMYHPILSNEDDNNHEFVELHNPGKEAVDLAGWKLEGEIGFTFPAGSVIAPGQYVVVARSRGRLLAFSKYELSAIKEQVFGDFTGALDNGGGRVALVDAAATLVDEVTYDDNFPWPLAADGFGAGDGWFEERAWFPATDPRVSFAAHKYLGHSLERVDMTAPATVGNWVASPLDRPSPGRANAVTGPPPAIVQTLSVGPQGDPGRTIIRATDAVLVRARFSPGVLGNPTVEYYVEFDRGRHVPAAPPARKSVPMTPGPMGHEAVLPALPGRTLVRYRIVAERAPGQVEVISPRPTDPVPFGHHPLYVSAEVGGKPHYEILVSPEGWGRMWSNIAPDGPVLGCPADYLDEPCTNCVENPSWNARVPAVFASGGEAYDMRARYQGSMEGRAGAEDITLWPAELPRPSVGPLKAMSWSIALPRYRRFEGQSRLVLNRLNQSCPGLSHAIAAALDEDERGGRAPAPRVRRFARVFVNGGAYNYMMDLEPIGAEYLERFHGKKQPIGDAYKLFSTGDDHGPWAPGFGQVIQPSPHCPEIPVKLRYERTYKRETHEWRPITELMDLVGAFSDARELGPNKVRDFLLKNFDVDATLKYYAVQQWGAPWDDNGKNYNVYKLPPQAVKAGQGAFTITSWDVDRMFGVAYCKSDEDCARADIPIHCDPELPKCNRWKRAFLESMRPEYDAKMKELNETLFAPANLKRIADEAAALYDLNEAQQMLASPLCDANEEAAAVRRFAERRYLAVRKQLGY